MKTTLTTLVAALALGSFAFAQPPMEGKHGGRGGHRHGLENLTKDLNLTADQQAKVQPILDAAKPQMKAIHEEAMTKVKAVMDNSVAQIRPLLTPEQQTKLDSIIKAHQDMMNAAKALHEAKTQ